VGAAWQSKVLHNVATLSTSPLGHVAYWPRLNMWTTWINHVADVSATWPKPTWPIFSHVATCGHVDLDHIATVRHVARIHVATCGHVDSYHVATCSHVDSCHMATCSHVDLGHVSNCGDVVQIHVATCATWQKLTKILFFLEILNDKISSIRIGPVYARSGDSRPASCAS
jgi:hypothetical protein